MRTHTYVERARVYARLEETEPLLRTVHGSRLYGLDHEGSDWDWYTVVPQPLQHSDTLRPTRVFQELSTDAATGVVTDTMVVGLTTFLSNCAEGVPQALEAMFAPTSTVDLLGGYRAAFRVNPNTMHATYRRSMRDHMLRAELMDSPVKVRRHVVRHALNLETALTCGRFSPVLSETERRVVVSMAESDTFQADLRKFVGTDLSPLPHWD